MTIHREGKTILWGTLFVWALLCGALYFLFPTQTGLLTTVFIVCLIFFLLFLQFFRSPTFTIPTNEHHLLAPADGKVVVIEDVVESEYLKKPCKQISIFMSPFNVHINRIPVDGVMQYVQYHKGKYLVAWHPKSSTENERTTLAMKMKNGEEILFRQIAGALAKRIKWYVKVGDTVSQGQEFGFIKFGSRVDIFIPLHYTVQVNLNQKTYGGRTVIASW